MKSNGQLNCPELINISKIFFSLCLYQNSPHQSEFLFGVSFRHFRGNKNNYFLQFILSIRQNGFEKFLLKNIISNLITLSTFEFSSVQLKRYPVSKSLHCRSRAIDHFRYIKIHTWLRGLGKLNKRNVVFIIEPQDDSFCNISELVYFLVSMIPFLTLFFVCIYLCFID